jgi:hypothetical protein
MSTSFLSRVALYAGVAVAALAYVAVTTNETKPDAGGTISPSAVREAPPARSTSDLAWRLSVAAVAVAVWCALDLAIASWLWASDRITFYLVRVLIGWGLLLALGAMLSAGHQRFLAAAIVFGMTAAFVGLWLAALASRRRLGGAS